MRTWTLEHDRGPSHFCIRLPETGIVACVEDERELAQFIVDACNEKEARDEERPLSPKMQALIEQAMLDHVAVHVMNIPRFTRISGEEP